MSYNRIEDLEVYMLAENLSNEIWDITTTWDFFAKDTIRNKFAGLQIQLVQILPKVMVVFISRKIRTFVTTAEILF